MDSCFSCGSQTDPDWVFCRSCGNSLDEIEGEVEVMPVSTPFGTPKVELISRGWDDVVDIKNVEFPPDPLHDDTSAIPMPAGGIEITVDSITVVEEGREVSKTASTDPWDHLRPHGEVPPLKNQTTTAARISQVAMLVVAFSALAAAGLRFYLNTRIDGFGDGRVSAQTVDDVTMVADVGLLVMVSLSVIAIGTLIWWFRCAYPTSSFRPGPAGLVALVGAIAGIALVATFFFLEQETVAEALAANSLIVIGLGLLMAACLAVVRTVGRIDLKEPV